MILMVYSSGVGMGDTVESLHARRLEVIAKRQRGLLPILEAKLAATTPHTGDFRSLEWQLRDLRSEMEDYLLAVMPILRRLGTKTAKGDLLREYVALVGTAGQRRRLEERDKQHDMIMTNAGNEGRKIRCGKRKERVYTADATCSEPGCDGYTVIDEAQAQLICTKCGVSVYYPDLSPSACPYGTTFTVRGSCYKRM